MHKALAVFLGATLLACGGLRAQNVVALPGFISNNANVTSYTANPLIAVNGFNAGASSFLALARPDGAKYYIVANSGSKTVTVVDNTFSNPRSLGDFGQQASAAVITPDGKRLLVAAGTLQIFDTATDSPVIGGGLNVNSSAFDVAVSLDGARAFVLGLNANGGSLLTSVDLSTNTVLATLSIGGTATGVAAAPNGLIYVSTQNLVLEINPATLTVTQGGTIQLNARPSRLAFTPDGHYGVAANLTPITGSAALLFDLTTHTLANTIPNFGITLDRFLVAGNNQLFAYSTQTAALYQVSITTTGGFNINPLSISGIGNSPITAATLSNEVAGAGQSTAQYLFLWSNGVLYRVDVASSQVSAQIPTPNTVGALSFVAPAISNASPAALLQYGSGQTIAPGGKSLPIVVQALDGMGRPISGVTVTFTASNANAVLTPASAVTGSNGYAETILTAPASAGPVNVTATAGAQTAVFTISVGMGSGGGATAGLSILAGQGQIVFENSNTGIPGFGSPLIVTVADANGNPVAGAPVTFTITQGSGTILGGTSGNVPGQVIVTTDDKGQASVNFLSTVIPIGLGFLQTLVTANATNTNTVTFYVTTTQMVNPPLVQVLTPQPGDVIMGPAGSIVKGAYKIQVTSNLGQAIPNVSLRLINPADPTALPSATCVDSTGLGVLTDSSGIATCDLLLNGKVGVAQVSGNVGYFNNTRPVGLVITPGLPGKILILQGNNQSGRPGQLLPLALSVQVSDAFGNVLSGTPVFFKVTPAGGATLTNVSVNTDQSGRASALARLGNIAGPVQVTVTAGTVTATFNLTVNIPSAGIQAVSGGGQSTLVNTLFASAVFAKVVDANGNGVAGLPVAFAVTSGSGSVGAPSVTTDANGLASTTVTAGSTPGPITVTATSGNFSTTFALSSRLPGPTNVMFLNGASFQQGLSPGSIVTITGVGIASGVQGLVTPNSLVGPLPTGLAGVSVTFNGVSAPIYSVSNLNGREQVTVQVPWETAVGTAQVVINGTGGGSATLSVNVQQFSPGIFQTTANGQTYGVALRPDGSYVSASNPARRGEIIRIYATGMGQVTPNATTGSAGVTGQDINAPVVVGVNNAGVRVVSARYAENLVGVYVIAFQIPLDTTPGPAQPIGLIVYDPAGNANFAQGTVLPIQ
jgi:uncharacterized protein (TIGR03437 family)